MALENVENKTFLKQLLNFSITCNLMAGFCKNGAVSGSLRNEFSWFVGIWKYSRRLNISQNIDV